MLTAAERIKKYNVDEILFFLAVIFKPLYLLPSGSFQIGDFLFVAAVAVHFITKKEKRPQNLILKDERSLLVFIIGVLIINSIYWLAIGSFDFLLSSAYYVFNFLIVLFVADVLQSDVTRTRFLDGLCNACKIVMLFQLIVYVTGTGHDYIEAKHRHLGTFNDPNQYAVYILLCMLIMLVAYNGVNIRSGFWFLLGTALIIPSGSVGAIISIGIFLTLFIILTAVKADKKKVLMVIACVAVIAAVLAVVKSLTGYTLHIGVVDMMISRFREKAGSISGFGDIFNYLVNDRIWNRVFEQPKYLLYGAGEGAHIRFDPMAHEIHSSILGPPFYYGIVPSFFLFRWVYLKLKNINGFQFCVYAAIIAESMILVNYRQPLFWLLFTLAGSANAESGSLLTSRQ